MLKRKGFTLIELLVVLAVLAILAALLFPVFSRVREKGRSTACQSNLTQVALAAQQYAQDYDGALPNFYDTANSEFGLRYLKNPQVLRCPSAGAIPENCIVPPHQYTDYYFNYRLQKLIVGLPALGIEEAAIAQPSNTVLSSDRTVVSEDGSISYYHMNAEENGGVRHSGGANYSFCDGHVKWLRPEKVTSACPSETYAFTFCTK